ncbi:transcription factor ABORTED MICROSPORES-like [Magnolia sinica]|uniref:transcription factor ABORTED MICROSPORES-like n=1 Tax=Magnolia sinica TaxID=86752 RepID=UPI00265B4C68|nr:transcription factor ABORTED MICROSPORES-like [Magnolia sinica]XP_058103371.1 transcription factor ABORTED MICROSPORES-like [Magnolia sinica]
MNKATIIDDAYDYIKALKMEVESLQNELVEITNEERDKPTIVASTSCLEESVQMTEKCKVEVVVSTIDLNKFNIKIVCEERQGGFTKLMEKLAYLGLEVTSINATTFKGVVLNTISVQGRELEILKAEQVKECLMQMVTYN